MSGAALLIIASEEMEAECAFLKNRALLADENGPTDQEMTDAAAILQAAKAQAHTAVT